MNAFGVEKRGVLRQNTFEVRFRNFQPLNNCLTSKISDSQKVRGPANMAGGVEIPRQT